MINVHFEPGPLPGTEYASDPINGKRTLCIDCEAIATWTEIPTVPGSYPSATALALIKLLSAVIEQESDAVEKAWDEQDELERRVDDLEIELAKLRAERP